MKIKLGLRGTGDAVNGIIILLDNLSLITSDNLFLIGEENRTNMGKDIVSLLNALDEANEITISSTVSSEIERELNMEEGTLNKWEIPS